MKTRTITVDKGVPLPARLGANARNDFAAKYPFREMAVGDSFEAEAKSLPISYWQNTTGFKFTCRKKGSMIRVWRTK